MVEICRVKYQALAHLKKPARHDDVPIRQGKIPWTYWGAIEDDKIIGCIGVMPPYKSKREIRLGSWFILPQYRGRGIGKALLITAINYAKLKGYEYIEAKFTQQGYEIAKKYDWIKTGIYYHTFRGIQCHKTLK